MNSSTAAAAALLQQQHVVRLSGLFLLFLLLSLSFIPMINAHPSSTTTARDVVPSLFGISFLSSTTTTVRATAAATPTTPTAPIRPSTPSSAAATSSSDAPSSSPSSREPTLGTPSPALTIPSLKEPTRSPSFSNTTTTNTTNTTTTPPPTSTAPVRPTPAPIVPSKSPSRKPSRSPTSFPSDVPSEAPSSAPSIATPVPSTTPSAGPTRTKTSKPSIAPISAEPSNFPSSLPSIQPTTNANVTVLTARVNIVLSPVNGTMDDTTLAIFINTTTSFFNDTLFATVENLQVEAVGQQIFVSSSSRLRQLQQQQDHQQNEQPMQQYKFVDRALAVDANSVIVPLQVIGNPRDNSNIFGAANITANITNSSIANTTLSSSPSSSLPNFNATLTLLVIRDGNRLVSDLQSTSNSYLKSVTRATATEALPSPPTPAPVSRPTLLPIPTPVSSNNNTKKGLSMGAIIGIAVGGAAVLLILLTLFLINRRSNSTLNRNTSDNVTFASMPMTVAGPAADDNSGGGGGRRTKTTTTSTPYSQSSLSQDPYSSQSSFPSSQQQLQQTPKSPSSYQQQQQASRQQQQQPRRSTSAAAAASQSSMADTQSDYGSELMGTDNHSDRGDTAGGDTMSYTYSLDAGLTDTFEGTSTMSGTASSSYQHAPVPTSIPQLSKSSRNRRGDNDDEDDDIDDIDMGGDAGGMGLLDDDLELDLGSVASSTLVGATGGTARVADQYITRECWAPPGKLGIVIDTTLEGPVVHKVNPGSPLEGMVWPGDIIIAIDHVDTRAMSASAITQLMIKTAKQRRKLTILSDATK